MKMLITGGAGFVGSHLCDKYVQNKDTIVTCLDVGNLDNVAHLMHQSNFTVVPASIIDANSLVALGNASNFDAVIHLAAQIRVDKAKEDPRGTMNINVLGTLNILEMARKCDITKVLFASSSEVYGSAKYVPINEDHPLGTDSIYGASKIAGDRLCHSYAKTYGMDIGILRPFNIYGPRQSGGVISLFIQNVLQGKSPIIHGDGSQVRDYVYIDDIVSAYDTMLFAKNTGAVNFGSGQGTDVNTIAETVIKVCNKNIGPEYRAAPANTTTKLVADIRKAKLLGWEPRYSLFTGIMKFVVNQQSAIKPVERRF